jgi:hypothetical protein
MATTIDFTTVPVSPGGILPNGYGDSGNVSVSYRLLDKTTGVTSQTGIPFYNSGFGDLTNVVYTGDDYGYPKDFGEVTLTAAAGFNVKLESFDLAGWGGSHEHQNVQLLDENFNVLSNLLTDGTVPGSGHSHFAPNFPGR